MKLFIALPLIPAMLFAAPALAGDVTVTLTGIKPNSGDLYVGLQTEEQFLQNAGIAGEIVRNPASETVTVTLRDVPDGRYSFSAWHDTDGDGTFSMGQNGPTDGWAMLNAAELRGMPTFAAQSFAVDGAGTAVTERMIYPEAARR